MTLAGKRIAAGEAVLGIELGSTRIKAVLTLDAKVVASGSLVWENTLAKGLWTYSIEDAKSGVSATYAALAEDVRKKHGVAIERLAAIGVSGMMHGYLPFDAKGKQLAAFRTWRNTNAAPAAKLLTSILPFRMPARWSAAHFLQAVLDKEEHVAQVSSLRTLAVHIHCLLTGTLAVGAGEAAGMFPLNAAGDGYDADMLAQYDALLAKHGVEKHLSDLLPPVHRAGESAGKLTAKGAKLLDPTGKLQPGTLLSPPEGDAATGMVATNSVRPGVANISAGTSTFLMLVLQGTPKPKEGIDVAATPEGFPVAMVHSNNGTGEIDALAKITGKSYEELFESAKKAEADCGGVVVANFLAQEPRLGAPAIPACIRTPESHYTLANLMRANIVSIFMPIIEGYDHLARKQRVETIIAHGGLFKSPVPAQILADLCQSTAVCYQNAGEGGPWGAALLAQYMLADKTKHSTLADYLGREVFRKAKANTFAPDSENKKTLERYRLRYKSLVKGLKQMGKKIC